MVRHWCTYVNDAHINGARGPRHEIVLSASISAALLPAQARQAPILILASSISVAERIRVPRLMHYE